jgi:hypothetical protein
MRVVHFTKSPESFDDEFTVHDTEFAFGGLCVYKIEDVQRSDYEDEYFQRDGIREKSEAWGGRAALIIDAHDADVELLQEGAAIDGLDEYIIRAGAKARIVEVR